MNPTLFQSLLKVVGHFTDVIMLLNESPDDGRDDDDKDEDEDAGDAEGAVGSQAESFVDHADVLRLLLCLLQHINDDIEVGLPMRKKLFAGVLD